MMNVRKTQLKSFQISAEKIGIVSYYEFLLSVLNDFTVGTEEYYLRCRNVNDGPQILYHYCIINLHLEVVNHKY